MDYIVLTERNNWEGETWKFYMPAEFNEGLLDVLETVNDPHYKVEIEVDIDTAEIERQIALLGEERAGEISFQAQQALDELLAEHSREAA